MEYKTRRGKIRVISFCTALFLVLGIWAVSATVKQVKYARIITASRQQALSDLGTYMDQIETSLTKGLYCSTEPMISSIASSLWRESTGAKTSLSHLGDEEIHLLGTYKFLSQVGDYTMYLNRKAAAGGEITSEEYENLKKFKEYAEKYSQQIDYMEELMYAGSLSFDDIDASLLDGDMPEIINFSDAATDSEKNVSDYPTLIYDGPFSDNIDNKESELLKNEPEISREEAKKTAAAFLGTSVDSLEDAGEEKNNLPSYVFQMDGKSIAITKKGGYVRYMLSDHFSGEETMSAAEAIDQAKSFLEKIGYLNMRDSYYSISDGIAVINFAYYAENVCCYTDLIKVGISLDNGDIVSFDATGYLINHKNREDLSTSADVVEKAKGSVSRMLTIKSWKNAIIPTDGGKEILTIEFLCESEDNSDVLVYINPETLEEEEILLLTYSDNGILTK